MCVYIFFSYIYCVCVCVCVIYGGKYGLPVPPSQYVVYDNGIQRFVGENTALSKKNLHKNSIKDKHNTFPNTNTFHCMYTRQNMHV